MAVIDDVVAAMGARHFSLGLARHRADHGQAQQLGPLRDDQAHAAGSRVQQDGLAGLERMDAAHQVGRGQAAHGHGRRGLEADGVRQADQRCGWHQALGAVRAQRVDETGIRDAIAHGDVGHARADGLHHARGLDAHAGGQRHRIRAIAEVGVGIVQAHRHVADAHLPCTGLSHRRVFVTQHLGAASLIHADDLCHALVS
ncbi:hypothetical protein D9M72_276000 [compost metagenome]